VKIVTVALFEQALSTGVILRTSVPKDLACIVTIVEGQTLTRCSPDPFDFAQGRLFASSG
jgi:hypothetical protein